VPVSSVLAFWAVAAVLIVVPGPDWAFAIGAGLRRQVVPAAGDLVAGYVAMTAVAAAGVGALTATPRRANGAQRGGRALPGLARH
jgi:threonine/homoserine/homoserine lactone efflux protein